MRKLNAVAVSLSVLASTMVLAQSQAQAATKVRILAGGKTAAVVKLPEGKVRYSAQTITVRKSLQGKKGPVKLAGKVSIDVFKGQESLMHITADEVVVEVE